MPGNIQSSLLEFSHLIPSFIPSMREVLLTSYLQIKTLNRESNLPRVTQVTKIEDRIQSNISDSWTHILHFFPSCFWQVFLDLRTEKLWHGVGHLWTSKTSPVCNRLFSLQPHHSGLDHPSASSFLSFLFIFTWSPNLKRQYLSIASSI